jgi:membrane protease YdiL (CAAX protease family)
MSQQQWGQPAVPRFPHAEPTPYHLMLRTWTYAWWKPVVGVLVVVAWFAIGVALVLFAVGALFAAFQSGSFVDDLRANTSTKDPGPVALLGINLGLASLILVAWFDVRVLHRMRPRWLTSVVPRMRWKFFAACLGIAVVALVVTVLVGSLLPADEGEEVVGKLNDLTLTTLLSGLVVLLTTPFQAAGEEYVFRGYLLQAFGSLSRNRWVAIVATALLFAFAHGSQNLPLFLDRFAFGLIAAWLAIRTGGLEAGIAFHVLNNYLAFGLALAYGDLGTTLNVGGTSWWNIVVTLTQSAVFTGLVVLVANRMGLQTRTQPPRDEPGPARGPAVATA